MTIQQGDIKIMASQVLADVDSGGGAATGNEIVDGQSNNLFPDISELDRTIGRVNLRKVFPAVRTLTNDGYYGVNAIVSDAPNDPAVSAVLFTTGEYFDTRENAQKRIESYLVQGTQYGGLLFGDHIAGMRTVTILQRDSVEIPGVGSTLFLMQNRGLASEVSQYVRATNISYRTREFAVPGQGDKTFKRVELTVELSDPLRYAFNGFTPADSYNDSTVVFTGKTQLFETVVADAANYCGITALSSDASIGNFSVNVDSIYTQIVPSAQVESPIADARMNQQTGALTPMGSGVTQSITMNWTTTQAMYIGGGIAPGTLTITREGVTITDKSGRLIRNSQDTGAVDYANGILTLAQNPWSTGGTFTVAYTPAGSLTIVTRSIGVPVTQQSQSLSQVVTLTPIPAPASLQVSYLSGGRWYVLNETGTGPIAGSDSTIGAGMLNYSTGTVTLTMGALPDIGSQVIYSWAPIQDRATVSTSQLENSARAFFEFSIGAIEPGSLSLSWNDGEARTATDNTGALQGYATGKVWYGGGRVQFSPTTMPSPGTVLTWAVTKAVQHEETTATLGDAGADWLWVLPGAPLKPGSLQIAIVGEIPMRQSPGVDVLTKSLYRVRDDGSGYLRIDAEVQMGSWTQIGTINYTTGVVRIAKSISSYPTWQGNWETVRPVGDANVVGPSYVVFTGNTARSTSLTVRTTTTDVTNPTPTWGWWSSLGSACALAQYAGSATTTDTGTLQLSQAKVASSSVFAGDNWYSADFKIGSSRYQSRGFSLLRDINPLTGEGTDVGTINGFTATFNAWPVGASSAVTSANIGSGRALGTSRDALTDGVIFRTAAAPLKPASFSVSGVLEDGTAISATADATGVINTTYIKGKVDVETGVVVLRFGSDTTTPSDPLNPGVGKINLSYLGISGVNWVNSKSVQADTLRYNAVAYSYIPLDANILGMDPVRLPSDGRVPIFRSGSVAVVHNTKTTTAATVTNGQTISTGRTRLARIRVFGANGSTINTGYTANLDAGTVTFNDVTGYSQPVRIEHRVEDAALVSSAQITGRLSLTRALTHDYTAGETYVSSALLIGDMQSRVENVYDQSSWTNVWSDDLIGDPATATFNTINYPIITTNLGAVTERWVIQFTSTTEFRCIGEHLGLVGTGNTTAVFAPSNPATGQPYFSVPALGWGGGWSTGNCLRLNTIGAIAPVWVARVIQQSQPSTSSDSFSILVRGDIDNPA